MRRNDELEGRSDHGWWLTLLFFILLGVAGVTVGAYAGLAILALGQRQFEFNLASRLVADYSVDPRGNLRPALDPKVLDDIVREMEGTGTPAAISTWESVLRLDPTLAATPTGTPSPTATPSAHSRRRSWYPDSVPHTHDTGDHRADGDACVPNPNGNTHQA